MQDISFRSHSCAFQQSVSRKFNLHDVCLKPHKNSERNGYHNEQQYSKKPL